MPTPRGADRLFTMGAGALAILFLVRAGALLAVAVPVDYGEGTTWAYARLLAGRGGFYLPIAEEPWIHGTYTPLFPLLQALLGGSLRAGRAVALGGTLLAAAGFAGLLAAHGVARRRALAWAAVLLGTPPVHEWAALCRVDTLALGLGLLGLLAATRIEGRRGDRVAAVLCALGFLTKQVALAAPAAVFLSLWVRGERRRAASFAALSAGLALGVLLVLQWRSGGEMWRHLVTYTGFVGWAAGPFVRSGLRFLFLFPVLLPLGLAGLGRWWRMPAGMWLLTGLAALALAGKPGASANYLIEPGAAVVLAAAVAAERRRGEPQASPERRRELGLLLAVQLVVLCQPGRPVEIVDLLRAGARLRPAIAALAGSPGPVLAEDLGLVLAAGKEPLFEPFQFAALARAGRFDPAPVLAGVREGRFGAVLAGDRLRGVPGLVPALEQAYLREGSVAGLELWRPSARP